MALIKCVECGNDVSDKAAYCPKCGKAVNSISENKGEKTNNLCKECGQEIDLVTGICLNCGFDLKKVEKKKRDSKKKISIMIGLIIAVVVLVLGIMFVIDANKGNSYILAACEELADEENGLPDIEAIYVSETVAEGKTIDYVYRIYIEYEGRWGTEAVLYIVDDKGNTYFATAYGDDKLANYLSLAKYEVNGIEGFFEPSDEWEELSSPEVKKFEKKLD